MSGASADSGITGPVSPLRSGSDGPDHPKPIQKYLVPEPSRVTQTKRESRKRSLAGALSGLLAGAAGVAVAEAIAALLTGVTSPLFAVANRAVDEVDAGRADEAGDHRRLPSGYVRACRRLGARRAAQRRARGLSDAYLMLS